MKRQRQENPPSVVAGVTGRRKASLIDQTCQPRGAVQIQIRHLFDLAWKWELVLKFKMKFWHNPNDKQTGAGRWMLHGHSERGCSCLHVRLPIVMSTRVHGYWSKPSKNLLHAALSSSQSRLRLQKSTQVCRRGAMQPQHVLVCTESLLIQLPSSISEEINVGGNKGQAQRSKTGVGSRRYMLTVSHLAP